MRHRRELQQLTIEGSAEVVASVDLSPTWGGARKGAGRKKGDIKTVAVSVRVPEVVHWQLRIGARKLGVSVSGFVRLLLHEGSKKYMPENWK